MIKEIKAKTLVSRISEIDSIFGFRFQSESLPRLSASMHLLRFA